MMLRWTERAAEHLEMLHAYVAEQNADAADGLLDRVMDAAENLGNFPLLGRKGRVAGTRELIVSGTHIIVAYRVHANVVQVLAVLHTSRTWPASF